MPPSLLSVRYTFLLFSVSFHFHSPLSPSVFPPLRCPFRNVSFLSPSFSYHTLPYISPTFLLLSFVLFLFSLFLFVISLFFIPAVWSVLISFPLLIISARPYLLTSPFSHFSLNLLFLPLSSLLFFPSSYKISNPFFPILFL